MSPKTLRHNQTR